MASDDIDPAETTLAEWVDRLAQAQGAPGGGAACGVMTGIAAGLLGMVAAYTAHDLEARQAEQRLSDKRGLAMRAAEEDGVRSATFGAALAMDQGIDRERAVREATVDAVASALDVGRIATSLLEEVRLLADIGNPHVEPDLRVAVELCGRHWRARTTRREPISTSWPGIGPRTTTSTRRSRSSNETS